MTAEQPPDLRAWAAGERAQWERERGHLTQHPCPGVWVHPDRCGGEPCLDGYRLPTAALYARWQLERGLVNGDDFAAIRDLAMDYHIEQGMQAVRVAVAFEAGRRWGEAHDRAERKRHTQADGAALARIEQALGELTTMLKGRTQ